MIFMKVKCISGENSFLNEKRESTYEFLEIGAIYTVYGMIINHGVLCYYICDRARDLFPIARPMHFFEIIDNRLSRFWVFSFVVLSWCWPNILEECDETTGPNIA